MGSAETKEGTSVEEEVQIPTDPLISRLRSAFRLKTTKNCNSTTHSFIHNFFSQQIIKPNNENINPCFSPFCSVFIKKEQKVETITCALISPIMAMAEAFTIPEPASLKRTGIEGILRHRAIKVHVKKIIVLKDRPMLLFVLEKPVWELGWCGVSFLSESQQINDVPVYIITNFKIQKEGDKAEDEFPSFAQKMSKIFVTDEGNFAGKSVRKQQGLLFQIIERKPYIVGVHKDRSALLMTSTTIKSLQDTVDSYLSLSMEREYLKQIDLQQMQIQTDW